MEEAYTSIDMDNIQSCDELLESSIEALQVWGEKEPISLMVSMPVVIAAISAEMHCRAFL